MLKMIAAALALGAATAAMPVAASAQQAAATERVPVSVFAQLPFMANPVISPSGRYLATKLRVEGRQHLAILDLDTPGSQPLLLGTEGDFDELDDVQFQDWDWVGDDHLVVTASSPQNYQGERYTAVRLIAYNRANRRRTLLDWEDSISMTGILWKSREGEPRILAQRVARLYGYEGLGTPDVVEINVATGRTRVVQRPNPEVQNWFADGNGVIRMGVSGDRRSGRTRILYRSNANESLRTISNERQDRYGDAPIPQVFLDQVDRALVSSNHEGFSRLYEVDLATMTMGDQVFGVEGYDIGGPIPNRDGNGLDGVVAIEEGVTFHWMNPRMREIQSVLEEGFGRKRARIVSANEGRTRLVVAVGAPNQAGAFYLYDTTSGNLTRLAWVNETLRDREMNPVRTIRYRASDGQQIPAVLTLPRHREHRNLPLIVMPHGGPWARDYEAWDAFGWTQALAELGYAVIQPNYRGSTGFGKAWTELADGNWGTRMQDDLNDAITALAEQGIADPARVCMMGWSYGGYAASRAAQRDGDKYRCTISGAGVHDIPEMVRYDRRYLGRYGSTFIGGAATDLRDVSPAYYAQQFSIPIMIIHGAKDQRVPVAQSRDLVRRLRAAGKREGTDFVYIEQPRNTHHLPLEADRIQVLEEVQRFLAQHNPA
jgi:dipeptidyl aminopeptidase/acylaminoacyl peptidase